MTSFAETAERINAHLQRFEADPKINVETPGGLRRYFHAWAGYSRGPKMQVQYISYQGTVALTKAEAEAYLAWLDAGNVGRHFEALRD